MTDSSSAGTGDHNSPWDWPRKWIRAEQFWMSLVAGVLATIISVGVLYLLGVAANVLSAPQDWGRVLTVILWLGTAIVVVLTAFMTIFSQAQMRTEDGKIIPGGSVRLGLVWIVIQLGIAIVLTLILAHFGPH